MAEGTVVTFPGRGLPTTLTKRQLATRLKRSTRWVEIKVREGMPVEEVIDRYGRRRYNLSAVEAWLAAGSTRERRPSTAERLAALEHTVAILSAEVEDLRRAR